MRFNVICVILTCVLTVYLKHDALEQTLIEYGFL